MIKAEKLNLTPNFAVCTLRKQFILSAVRNLRNALSLPNQNTHLLEEAMWGSRHLLICCATMKN
jgi:hypothetical protein